MAFSSPRQVFWFVREPLWYVKTNTKSLFVVSKSRLGAFLGPSWAILEPSWSHLGATSYNQQAPEEDKRNTSLRLRSPDLAAVKTLATDGGAEDTHKVMENPYAGTAL